MSYSSGYLLEPEGDCDSSSRRQKRRRKCPMQGCLCQAAGCTSVAGSMRLYHKRKHLCLKHMQADYVQLEESDGKWRFCFQCGKLERLELFDGHRRSCRTRLEKRRSHPRKRSPRKQAASPAATASQPAAAPSALEPFYATAMATAQPSYSTGDVLMQVDAGAGPTEHCSNSMGPSNDSALQYPGCSSGSDASGCAPWGPAAGPPPANASANCANLALDPAETAAASQWQEMPGLAAGAAALLAAGSPAAAAATAAAAAQPAQGSSPCADTCDLPCAAPTAAGCHSVSLPLGQDQDTPLLVCPTDSEGTAGTMDADVSTLQLLLESELAVAALEAGIASSGSTKAHRDPDTQRVAEQLAAVLVRESHLFDAAGGPGDLLPNPALQQPGLSESLAGAVPVCSVPLSPKVSLLGPLLTQHSCTGSSFSSSVCEEMGEWCASLHAPAAAAGLNPEGSAVGVCHSPRAMHSSPAASSGVLEMPLVPAAAAAAAAAASCNLGPLDLGLTNALVGMTNPSPAGAVAGWTGCWVPPTCNAQAPRAAAAVCGMDEWDRRALAIEQQLQGLQSMRARVCQLQCNVVALKHDLGL